MAKMTPSQWRQYASQWQRAGKALDGVRREELAAWQYDPSTVNALLDIGAKAPRKEEEPNGLVEMQKWFMKIARKQGLLPAVREESAGYGSERAACLPKPGRRAGPAGSDEAERLVCYNNAPLPPGPRLALFCSVKCPGKLILDTYDLVQHLRDNGVTVIGGFHSPMEQECLRILLRSPNPVVWCLARGLLKSIPPEFRPAVDAGRLVIASTFPDKLHRITAQTAMIRNRVVADMAAAVVVAHAAPGSKMETLCRELLAVGKPLYTFDHSANAALIQLGARSIPPDIDWQGTLVEGGRWKDNRAANGGERRAGEWASLFHPPPEPEQ